jgi:hypothetical protein
MRRVVGSMFEKIIERLEEKKEYHRLRWNKYLRDDDSYYALELYQEAIEIVKEVAADMNVGHKNGWIPCSERVPNYEEAWYHNEEDDIYEPNEFIVMIKGAEIPTVLFYDTAFEEWTDGCDNVYEVIAWQSLPEPYEEKEND